MGALYPQASTSADLWFQHFAVVVADIRAAHARIAAQRGFTAISRAGPEQLPASAGGAMAFKFRDPDGHPLELLEFAPAGAPPAWRQAGKDLFLGIDHSAISVGNVAASVEFYEQTLGLLPGTRSLNHGAEQGRLDGLEDPLVDVVPLHPRVERTPSLELLGYRRPRGRRNRAAANDIAATHLVFEASGIAERAFVSDPDGHYLVLIPAGA